MLLYAIYFTASVHAGMGLEDLNTFLTTLNLHHISSASWVSRQAEITTALKSVADESVHDALEAENSATL